MLVILSGNGEWRNQLTLIRGSGQVASKLVGSLGRIPIRSQKQLKGKKGKFHNGRWYQKGVVWTVKGTRGKVERKERIEKKNTQRKTRERKNMNGRNRGMHQ